MPHHFFAYLSRMKFIDRWSLMKCHVKENVQEHSLQVAVVAHSLALIKNKFFNGNVNAERVALLAMFHDATEVLTGDLPTPVKYYNDEIREAYKQIESHSTNQLLRLLPENFREEYRDLLNPPDSEQELRQLIKAADSICAYVKCLEELSTGNTEFSRAKRTIENKLSAYSERPEVQYFLKTFTPGFAMTLDEISQPLES